MFTATRTDDPVLTFDIYPHRVRVELGGYLLAESERVIELREQGHEPVLYFPASDVRRDRLRPSVATSHCPRKGDASYFDIQVGSCLAKDAVWSYASPLPAAARLTGYVAFYPNQVDAWDDTGQRLLGSDDVCPVC